MQICSEEFDQLFDSVLEEPAPPDDNAPRNRRTVDGETQVQAAVNLFRIYR